jgi:hypothetical protein
VQVAGTTRPCTHGERACELSLGGSGERAGLLVANLHPIDTVGAPHCVDNRVEAVAHDAVDMAHPCGDQLTDKLIGNGTVASHASSLG